MSVLETVAVWAMWAFRSAVQFGRQGLDALLAWPQDPQSGFHELRYPDQRIIDRRSARCWRCDARPGEGAVGLCPDCHKSLAEA